MKKNLFIIFFSIIIVFTAILCGISGGMVKTPRVDLTYTKKPTVAETTVSPTYSINSKEPLKLAKGSAKVIVLTQSEEKLLESWTSSNNSIVTVDSGGRIDAKSKGSATITAVFSNHKKTQCKVTVTDASKSKHDGFSTCITANAKTLEKNKKSNSSQNLYYIKVNRKKNCVTVYTYDENGEYTVPVRAMVCSCGQDDGTITGDFSIYFKNEWHPLFDNVYGHYVSGISGDYLFHSVPYYSPTNNRLEVDEFNKLGKSASLGCVRMAVADSKWIFDNCAQNTGVTIYDDDTAGPLGKPETIKIKDKSCGWDPTDNSKNNPYYSKKPIISGAQDCVIDTNGSFFPLGAVTAVDTCSNDITKKISVTGNVVTSRPGKYKVTYTVEDALHRTAKKNITVTVKQANPSKS